MDQFDVYFRRADLDGDGRISEAEAVGFFQASNLPKPVLVQIWDYADQACTGFLDRPEFYNALKLVTVAQSKRDLTPDIVKAALYGPAAAKIPAPQINLAALPQSTTNVPPIGGTVGPAASPSSQNFGIRGPAAPNATMGSSKFDVYFRRADLDGDGRISEAEAVGFFQASNLPKLVLAQIWAYADQACTGFLGRPEFYNALKLVTVAQSKRELTPDIVEAALYGPAAAKIPAPQINLAALPQSTTNVPQIGGTGGPAASPSSQNFGIRGPAAPNATMGQPVFPSQSVSPPTPSQATPLGTSPCPPQGVPNSYVSSGDWFSLNTNASGISQLSWPKMKPSDVQKYTKVFEEVDTDRDGKITGEQARHLFLSWKLPREVLKQVWDLSDQDNDDSMLSLREFCIALYLMERYRGGQPLPTALPSNILDETLFSASCQNTVSYGNTAWAPNPGLAQHHLLKSNFINLNDIDDENYADLHVLNFMPIKSKPSSSKPFLETGQSSKSKLESESKPVQIEKEVFFMCEICADEKPVHESCEMEGCNHLYCTDCMIQYVASKLQDNITAVQCPISQCPGLLEPEYCRGILRVDVFERWGNALCESILLASEKFYCPLKHCSALLINDGGGEIITLCECPNCGRLFCAQCKCSWHMGISCEEYQSLKRRRSKKRI